MTDAYQGSGGWSGGSPLMGGQGGVYGGTDSILGSYMQSMKQYDPASGAMKTARPQQSNAQMSSLARTIQAPEGTPATYNTQQTAATPTTQAPVTVNVQAPAQPQQQSTFSNALLQSASSAAPAGMQLAPGRNAQVVPASSSDGMQLGSYRGSSYGSNPKLAEEAAAAGTQYNGQAVIITGSMANGTGSNTLRKWDAARQQYVPQVTLMATPSPDLRSSQYQLLDLNGNVIASGPDAYTKFLQMKGFLGGGVVYEGANENEALAKALAANKPAIDENAAAATQARINSQAASQGVRDDFAAQAAQAALDKASAFDLAGSLQAPNTSAQDAAGAADLARVISKYAASGYGPEAASLAAIGSRDAGTQATINKVNHDTAYATAFNQNYGVFADAVRASRDTSIAASGQRLAYDMQGVDQAVKQLVQQAGQLDASSRVSTEAALLPLQKALQVYDLAKSQYGADSKDAKDAATAVLSLGGALAAGGVKK